MRIVALLATYNEHRFIGPCLEHLHTQGIDTYLIDNCSTDDTVEIAERHRGEGLIGIEELPRRDGTYNWHDVLRRKEQLTRELDADWFIHLDADEVRLPPVGMGTLAEAFEKVDEAGYNAINFLEFTFVPSREQPDHDHPHFQRTLHTYYSFCPESPHRLNAWKAAAAPDPDLAASGGHRVRFTGLHMYKHAFPMRHYLFLSIPHAIEKYVHRRYNRDEVKSGWHGWRARVTPRDLRLPSESELRIAHSDDDLDPSEPRKSHYIDEILKAT